MVAAWYYNEASTESVQSLRQFSPNRPVSLDYLRRLGVSYWKIPVEGAVEDPNAGLLGDIRKERGYSSYDIITINREKLPNYDEKIAMFFKEHIHEDEEIRFCVGGSGYFDVRDELKEKEEKEEKGEEKEGQQIQNEWIRILVEAGDLIVLPAGSYHRFAVDAKDFIHVIRLFKDNPKWEAINRGQRADETSARDVYLKSLKSPNGEAFLPSQAPKPLANYPHLRTFGGLAYLSGFSSRKEGQKETQEEQKEEKKDVDEENYPADIKLQTKAVFSNISSVLKQIGADLSHLLSLTVYLKNIEDYAAFNEAYNELFPEGKQNGPVRTTLAVASLPHPKILIEIQGVAADPRA